MGKTFNLVGAGGKKHNICGYVWARNNTTSFALVGNTNQGMKTAIADNDCFSYDDNGTFTCNKAGTYTISYFGRGSYNTSGTPIQMAYQILKNASVEVSANNVTNSGTQGSFSVSLAVNDTIKAQTQNASGSTAHDFGYVITRSV